VIDGMRAPFRFEGAVREAIHQLKYQNLRALAQPLAQLLADYLTVSRIPGTVLTAVPLHQKRLRERGYNQSALLATKLGKLTGLPVSEDYLIRQRPSSPRARTQTVAERRSNVNDAFCCPDNRVKDRAVIVIDDVATSGATLNACASALKTAGASSVWGLTLAREI
jgi:ComF family protein